MSASDSPPPRSNPTTIAEQAATWLARRDRGLTPAEQDDYTQWLAADRRHVEAVTQHAAAFERMMTLYEWQPGPSAEPNPDLFGRRSRWRGPAVSLAAAAALLLCATLGWYGYGIKAGWGTAHTSAYLRVNERQALPDGSLVELKDGSHLTVAFTPTERRVKLVGEGLFKVAKNAERPFIVEAGGVAVRAVGTAFNVRVDGEAVDVLVTEGRVRVHPPGAAPAAVAAPEVAENAATFVAAQQRLVVNRLVAERGTVKEATPDEITSALAWQTPRLQFLDTPLAVAVAEFNQRNARQIVFGDSSLKPVLIGGSFRVDNIDGFIRVVEVTLDVHAETRGREIVLTRGR